eukprot:CAMPEP_0113469400 /NCGR_PEP_ID=MMETSP0014_2-20120614/15878_1 /TAXON_ID=2857 /ORGANISM="Nitzschia sp." /LENGTH=178 /DNA_ID=CAMNT_0000361873 /DNA_START=1 /DNA_END=537 /DNA_ORIENTATION=- /assembly_acc=CAM_ASM_000159
MTVSLKWGKKIFVGFSRNSYRAGATSIAVNVAATSRRQFASVLRQPSALLQHSTSALETPRPSFMATSLPPPPPHGDVRTFASLSEGDIRKRLDGFQDLFVEARLCIEDVVESAGTKYFDDDAEEAQRAVDEAVAAFTKLIDDIESADEKNKILRGNGLKVEQLKGELELALKGGHDH